MGAENQNTSIVSALFGKTRRAILSLLFSNPDKAFFLRQIARSAQSGMGAVQRELQQLADAGILVKTTSGRQVYFQANKNCPIYNELRQLIAKTIGIAEALGKVLSPLSERIIYAFIFGSVASGKETANSDIDLMIVGQVSFGEVVVALQETQQYLGREINPTVYPEEEFKKKVKESHHFLKTVLGEEKIFLMGNPNELERMA